MERQSDAALYGMMRYHLGWCDASFSPTNGRTGKRLRPLLTLLCCEGLGGDWRVALPYAAAIELVHNFSLIHDDIEDNSDTRHERATVWHVWGLAQGINTGDAMWSIARLALHDLASLGHSPEMLVEAVRLLDQACLNLCSGQYLDLDFESRPFVTLDEYLEMAQGKTAALLAAAFEGGGVLAGADQATRSHLAAAGMQLGLAYQVIDDLLGVWGNVELTGKSAMDDIASRKKNLPVVYALQWERARGSAELFELYAQPSSLDVDRRIVELLEATGAADHARERARSYHLATLEHLQAAGLGGIAGQLLLDLVNELLSREY